MNQLLLDQQEIFLLDQEVLSYHQILKHNKSIFYEKFKEAIEKLGFDKLQLKAPVDEAADVVMTDKGHLNPNPIPIAKEDVVKCLNDINDGNL